VIALSEPAAGFLEQAGWRVSRLPLPIRHCDGPISGAGTTVTVLGQWKPARSLEPLHALGADPALDGRRRIIGRGWQPIEGWDVENRFVSEAELEGAIESASCAVLPYDRYFQSDIAMRCLEHGRPVVGTPHPFLRDLYGEDWPGIVRGGDWAGAVARAEAVSPERLAERRVEYWERCVQEWGGWLNRLAP